MTKQAEEIRRKIYQFDLLDIFAALKNPSFAGIFKIGYKGIQVIMQLKINLSIYWNSEYIIHIPLCLQQDRYIARGIYDRQYPASEDQIPEP